MKNEPNKSEDQSDSSGQSGGRKLAEWVTMITSAAIVLATAGYLIYSAIQPDSSFIPLQVTVQRDQAHKVDDQWIVPVEAKNKGNRPMRDLVIKLTFYGGREPDEGDAHINYLAAHAEQMVYVQTDQEPKNVQAVTQSYQLD